MPQSDLHTLRHALARRLQEKAELEQRVRAAQSQYEAEVAPLQEEVLRLQMERLKEAAQARMRSARLRNAYHDAQAAYEQFREQRTWEAASVETSDENVKATYRRATKLCHPDAVPDPYHEEAAATFQALESAYDAGHSKAVRAIAETLEKWGFPRAPAAAPDELSSRREASLRQAVSEVNTSIERLRTSDVFQTVTENPDVESMVGARKRALRKQLGELKRQRRPRF